MARAGMLSGQWLSRFRTEPVPAPGSVGQGEKQGYAGKKSLGFQTSARTGTRADCRRC